MKKDIETAGSGRPMATTTYVNRGRPLREVCDLFRSRNAGAFLLTFDFVLDDAELFDDAVQSGIFESVDIGRRLGVAPELVRVTYFRQGNAIKLTVPRRTSGGGPEDHDVDGAQQFVVLLDLTI